MAVEALMVHGVDLRQPLRWFGLWRGAGLLLVVWVIYESLTPTPIDTSGVEFGDKYGHFLAYFTMMSWFTQLYRRPRHTLLLFAFIAMGVTLEFIQGQTGYRTFDYANSLGACGAWLLASGSFSSLLLCVEQRLNFISR